MYVLNPTNPHIDLLLKYCLGGGAWAKGTYSVIPLAFCVPLLGDLALRCENHVLSGHSCQWRPPHVCGLGLTKNHTSYNLELLKPFFSNHPVPKQGLPLAPIWRKWSKPCPLGVEKAPLLYVANLKVWGGGLNDGEVAGIAISKRRNQVVPPDPRSKVSSGCQAEKAIDSQQSVVKTVCCHFDYSQ